MSKYFAQCGAPKGTDEGAFERCISRPNGFHLSSFLGRYGARWNSPLNLFVNEAAKKKAEYGFCTKPRWRRFWRTRKDDREQKERTRRRRKSKEDRKRGDEDEEEDDDDDDDERWM